MGFNKKFISESHIEQIEKNPQLIHKFLKADSLVFTSTEVSEKFKNYEKQYRPL